LRGEDAPRQEKSSAWAQGGRRLSTFFGDTLQGRFTLVMVLGVLVAQLVTNALWAQQLQARARLEAQQAAEHLATGAAGAIRSFRELPVNYRPLLIEQLRTVGGTRFFVFVNHEKVEVESIRQEPLADRVSNTIASALGERVALDKPPYVSLAWPQHLAVSPEGVQLRDLPEAWLDPALLNPSRPAPVVVVQAEIESGAWLYLASSMPDPYFLDNANPYTLDRLLPQGITLIAVLLLSVAVVRTLTRPLARLGSAAQSFGHGSAADPLPVTGTREVRRTTEAFNAMQERIQRYLVDRDRLFASISHDLRTPITRLMLRTELIDDEAMRTDFQEDLDDLDMMVKSALQSVKDADIHENIVDVRLDQLLERMVRDIRLGKHEATLDSTPTIVRAKPLALKRALTNLLDNAIQYGQRAEITVRENENEVVITIRDHGPGVPEAALEQLGQPYLRLEHGLNTRRDGMGLGLGIARNVIEALGGRLRLANHPEGGLIAVVTLPRA
jgi:signal transduction histidine kinase